MKHMKQLTGQYDNVGPLELAEDLGNLRYDGLAEYLDALSKKLRSDAVSDAAGGRGQLAIELELISFCLEDARDHTRRAWKICDPYMEENGS